VNQRAADEALGDGSTEVNFALRSSSSSSDAEWLVLMDQQLPSLYAAFADFFTVFRSPCYKYLFFCFLR